MKTSNLLRSPSCGSIAAVLFALRVVAGPSVSSFGMFKMRQHEQAGPPPAGQTVVNGHGVYSYVVQSAPGSLLLASVSPAGGAPMFMSDGGDDPLVLESQAGFETEAKLDSEVPDGRLDFQFIDKTASVLAAGMTLGGRAYPAAPVLKNFAAAQDIDRSSPFTLQWDAPAGLAATDYVIVQVDDGDGNRVAGSPRPWQSGALSGTTTTFTIPAGALPAGAGAEAEIIAIHVTATDTADIQGAMGLVGYIASTRVPLAIRGGGGDATPPSLLSATPVSGSVGWRPTCRSSSRSARPCGPRCRSTGPAWRIRARSPTRGPPTARCSPAPIPVVSPSGRGSPGN